MKITPNSNVSSYRMGSLVGITKAQIDSILGFKPNMQDDASKVKHSWGFSVRGKDCAVWDWKGSHRLKEWSVYGPDDVLRKLFGDSYVSGA